MATTSPEGRGPARPRSAWTRALFAAVPLVVLLLFAEGVCRVAGIGTPDPHLPSWPRAAYRDVELTAPDGTVSTYAEGIYSGAPVRINARGYRGWLYAPENREGALRVAALGDSFTFGDGLRDEETWPARLEERLAGAFPRPVRTINLGRRGSNTDEQATRLRGEIGTLRPDVVVLGFTVTNDAQTAEHRQEVVGDVARREAAWWWRTARWIDKSSYLAHGLVRWARRRAVMRDYVAHVRSTYRDDAPGWPACAAALRDIAATCRERKVGLVVVIFPALYRTEELNDFDRYALQPEHDKVRAQFAEHPEVVVVDVLPSLREVTGGRLLVPGDGHPGPLYAAKVAERLDPDVRRLLAERAGR